MLKQFIITGLSIVLFTACGSATDAKKGTKAIKNTELTLLSDSFEEDGLREINNYRSYAGLIHLTNSELLSDAAQKHATYQIKNNLYTHQEKNKTPNQRAIALGYTHDDIAENIYAGDVSAKESVDILFANIYHRLAFLDFGFDEIGLGMDASNGYDWKKVYTYEMGRENQREFNQKQNPKIVLYPYKNQQAVMPVFYEEFPDPLPECSVSGYPISLQFNPAKSGAISVKSFELYDENNRLIKSKLLKNDRHLSTKEFVLMPLSRLEFDTTYQVKVNYKEENSTNKIEWEFTTKSLPEPYKLIKKPNQVFHVKSGETYYFYMPPKDCNDKFSSYTYKLTNSLKIKERMIDNNTLMIKATGKGRVVVDLDNGESFRVEVL